MTFDAQQKSEEKQPEIDNRGNDHVVAQSVSLDHGVPENGQAPYLPFELALPGNDLQDRDWSLKESSTLLIGEGDLTAVALMFAENSAWHDAMFIGGKTHPQATLFFKGVREPLVSNFANQLQQVDIPKSFPQSSEACGKSTIPSTRDKLLYQPKIRIYPSACEIGEIIENMQNFKWLVYPNQVSFRPWQSYFEKELLRMKSPPEMIFCDGWLDDDSRLLRDDITELGKWLKRMKSQGRGIVLTASKEFALKKLYRLFDQVIEFKPWRPQKCGSRNLVATLHKLEGEYLKHSICFHIKSPKDKIAWKEVGKRYDLMRSIIAALIREGFTAKEQVIFLDERYSIKLSLPMLAKLKRDWGLRTYKRSIPKTGIKKTGK